MLPTVALVGRPNVGKSTLFNRLARGRDALVADVPGLTRDRRYGRAALGDVTCTLIDTGGLLGDDGELTAAMEHQAELAMDEADLVALLVDARSGLTPHDEEIATRLRRNDRRVMLVVNKMDGISEADAIAEFAGLGFDDMLLVAAAHGRGMDTLSERLAELLEPFADAGGVAESAADDDAVRVAVIGRPNVGKSTLINRLLGEERQVVFDEPGTTRDAIDIPFERDGTRFVLIDTAGVRRRGRVEAVVEKFSVVKTLQAVERAHVVILVLDAREGLVDQDLHLLSYAAEAGSALVVALNKWDGLSSDERARNLQVLDRRLRFAPWLPVRRISALHGTGVGNLLGTVMQVYAAGELDVGTSYLTRILEGLVQAHAPPMVHGRPIKLRFAHKAGSHPPRIVIHGNQTSAVPASYVRYLENGFREALDLVGTPVKIELRTGENPFAGRRNTLTPRQEKRRKRMVRHHKTKKR
ncbi:MAG: ribosome biogenesis GTPase Der [Gammaproteobacteria bacterium]|nr:ribosome biogenesis GTPase Der [Gammaproteobacteria bacterium]